MDVPPAGERPLDLLVDELAVLLEVGVARDPAEADRRADLEHHAAAVPDAAGALDHPRVLPRRGQPLERARPLVPGEHRLGGERQAGGALET